MILLSFLQHAAKIIGILFFVCYAYQLLYALVALFDPKKREERPPVAPPARFAVLISARNEESVITRLLESIQEQDYPAEYLVPFVVADNCTDGTAHAAREAGAVVLERMDRVHVGKGYALDYLLQHIRANYGDDYFDAYLVFDADNLLQPDYVSHMNDMFHKGYNIITSCRNSKNYGDNWISAGHALWFLRDSTFLNAPRFRLGISAAVAGTGFLFSGEIMRRNDGWPFHCLCEDTEFTVASILQGEKVGYCDAAEFFDEQPTQLSQSIQQRMRWAKGNMQIFRRYSGPLAVGIFHKNGLSCLDTLLSTPPAILLTFCSALLGAATVLLELLEGKDIFPLLLTTASSFAVPYLLIFLAGALTTIAQWRRIRAPGWKKLMYMLTFPLFMTTYVPITLAAPFTRGTWRPIHHKVVVSIRQIK